MFVNGLIDSSTNLPVLLKSRIVILLNTNMFILRFQFDGIIFIVRILPNSFCSLFPNTFISYLSVLQVFCPLMGPFPLISAIIAANYLIYCQLPFSVSVSILFSVPIFRLSIWQRSRKSSKYCTVSQTHGENAKLQAFIFAFHSSPMRFIATTEGLNALESGGHVLSRREPVRLRFFAEALRCRCHNIDAFVILQNSRKLHCDLSLMWQIAVVRRLSLQIIEHYHSIKSQSIREIFKKLIIENINLGGWVVAVFFE